MKLIVIVIGIVINIKRILGHFIYFFLSIITYNIKHR